MALPDPDPSAWWLLGESKSNELQFFRVGRLLVQALHIKGDLVELKVSVDQKSGYPIAPIRQSDLAAIPLVPLARFAQRHPQGQFRPDRDPKEFVIERPDRTIAWRKRFAEVYEDASVSFTNPARVIADASGLPVSAVRRWAHEARLRGDLPGMFTDEEEK